MGHLLFTPVMTQKIEVFRLLIDQINSLAALVYLISFHLRCKSKIVIQWGWDITGQKITGQSCPDWLKMTSSRTSKPNIGGLRRF